MLSGRWVLCMQTVTNDLPTMEQSTGLTLDIHAIALLGPSKAVAQLCHRIKTVATQMRGVLLAGPADCGQEAVARMLLLMSTHPFRVFHSLRPEQAELHLPSLREHVAPHGRLLFLPDVDQLSAEAQHNLLKLLRSHRHSTSCVVAATSKDLRVLVGEQRFRSELFEALSAQMIVLPSLSDRAEDLPMLLTHSIELVSQAMQRRTPILSSALLRAAMDYSWPGNLKEVSEMTNALLSDPAESHNLDVAEWRRAQKKSLTPPHAAKSTPATLEAIIRDHVYGVLVTCGGNKLRAAELLGISRSTLYRFVKSDGQAHGSLRRVSALKVASIV